mmetsp:Transcript_25557/g.75425  ORF Transcript_25557/g.75425 Transcript_25557/m.75425 type:complete len:264 (+) Transcript_25557:851-1642(+)
MRGPLRPLMLQDCASRHPAHFRGGHRLRHLPLLLSPRVTPGRRLQPLLAPPPLCARHRRRAARRVHLARGHGVERDEHQESGHRLRLRFAKRAAPRPERGEGGAGVRRDGGGVVVVLPPDDGDVRALPLHAPHGLVDRARVHRRRADGRRHDRHVRRGVLLGRAALLLGQGRVAVDLLAALLVDAARAVLAARPPRLWHRVRLLASGRERAARSGFRARLRGGGGEDGREGVLSGRGSYSTRSCTRDDACAPVFANLISCVGV